MNLVLALMWMRPLIAKSMDAQILCISNGDGSPTLVIFPGTDIIIVIFPFLHLIINHYIVLLH